MTTGASFVSLEPKRIVGRSDFREYFLDYLRTMSTEVVALTYSVEGTFFDTISISADGNDKFQLQDGKKGTDGVGHILQLSNALAQDVQFENTIAVVYHVGLKYAERPRGVTNNPRTGFPDITRFEETIGESGTPNSVVDNLDGTLTFRVDTVTEASVTNAGRKVLVWKKNPGKDALLEADAIEECTVAFSGGQNKITTVGTFGQASPSTTAADYVVLLLGPTVKRNTDLSAASGYHYIGTVTGAGAGSPPSTFDITGQNEINSNFSALDGVTRVDAHGDPKISVQADASDVDENQIEVKSSAGVVKFSVDEDGDVVIEGNLHVKGTETVENTETVVTTQVIAGSLQAGDADGDAHTVKGSWTHTANGGALTAFKIDGVSGRIGIGANNHATIHVLIEGVANDLGLKVTGGATDGSGIEGVGQGTGFGLKGTGGGTSGRGVWGVGGAPNGDGVRGDGTGTGKGGVFTGGGSNGYGAVGTGVGSGSGLKGTGGTDSGTFGVEGVGAGPAGIGVYGIGAGTGTGVNGTGGSGGGKGVVGTGIGAAVGMLGIGGSTGAGVEAVGGGTNGTTGLLGYSLATNGHGVKGTGSGTGIGVEGVGGSTGVGVKGSGGTTSDGIAGTGGTTNGTIGVTGTSAATNGHGVRGTGTGTGTGVIGVGGGSNGKGADFTGSGTGAAVVGLGGATAHGAEFTSPGVGMAAVLGTNTAANNGIGVKGVGGGTNSFGVIGQAADASGAVAVHGNPGSSVTPGATSLWHVSGPIIANLGPAKAGIGVEIHESNGTNNRTAAMLFSHDRGGGAKDGVLVLSEKQNTGEVDLVIGETVNSAVVTPWVRFGQLTKIFGPNAAAGWDLGGEAAPWNAVVAKMHMAPPGTVTLNSAGPTLTIGDLSYIQVTVGASASGTVVMSAGRDGQHLDLFFPSVVATVNFVNDTSNAKISTAGTFSPAQFSHIGFVYDGGLSKWIELYRGNAV
jgi:hypothetical protein